MYEYQKVKLIGLTKPLIFDSEKNNSAENLISYCARVSNPFNQTKYDTSEKLLKYLMMHKHYRKIWEEHNQTNIPDGYEIHHIDGNNTNNDPSNLLCVSIEEHLQIHKQQEDWGAVQAILARMENREGIKEAARKAQIKRFEENRHNFQLMKPERRTEISKKTLYERLKKEGVAFLGIKNTKLNARNAGKMAADKKAGFLDTQSENHGSKHVKGTCWWTNLETGERIRAKEAPNEKWKRGMIK